METVHTEAPGAEQAAAPASGRFTRETTALHRERGKGWTAEWQEGAEELALERDGAAPRPQG